MMIDIFRIKKVIHRTRIILGKRSERKNTQNDLTILFTFPCDQEKPFPHFLIFYKYF